MLRKIMAFSLAFLLSSLAFADYYGARKYEVTITNITKGEAFTPILSATHKSSISFFELGAVASEPLTTIAESGDIAPLKAVLDGSPLVRDTANTDGLLEPGNTITLELSGNRHLRLSLAAMLIPTNDTFVALNSVRLPRHGSRTYYAKAYDAGSETNDELCANIPGPPCFGVGASPGDEGEGFIHISAGIHGEGELAKSAYDWRDAVAKIVVRRVYY